MQQLIYEAVVPVSSQRHGRGSVELGGGYGFARGVNSFPLMVAEFAPAAAEYLIVFASTDGVVVPLAVVGARKNENAYVSDDGRWLASYVPAFVRRYPYVLLAGEDKDTFTLCIDEAFAGLNFQGRGEALFDADERPTRYVDGVLAFLQEYRVQFQRTAALCAKLEALDLLEPMQAQFTLDGGEKLALTGFKIVSRDRLKALAPEALAELARGEALELVYLHLHSTRNLADLKVRLGKSQPSTGHEASS